MTKKQVEEDTSGGLSEFFKNIFRSSDTPSVPNIQPQGKRTSGNMSSAKGLQATAMAASSFTPPHLSQQEEIELDNLESKLAIYTKNKKLERFKQLPSNIRQEIVDEAIIKDLRFKFTETEAIDDFLDLERLNALRIRDYSRTYMRGRGIKINPISDHTMQHLKYPFITNIFTVEELMEAHAEASLEDEIAD